MHTHDRFRTAILLLALLGGCRTKAVYPNGAPGELPPETRTGAGTFGFRLDGQVWKPQGYDGTANLDLSYDPGYGGGTFDLKAYRIRRIGNGEDIREFLSMGGAGISAPGTYHMDSPDGQAGATIMIVREGGDNPGYLCVYSGRTKVYRRGRLVITRLDVKEQVASGRFEFLLHVPGCDTLRITEGRFDMKF